MDADDARFREAVDAWAQDVRRRSERDDGAWARQRAGIAARLADRRPRLPALAWAVMAAATAVVVAGIWMAGGTGAHDPRTTGASAADPDDELIAEVEAAVTREMPLAFEPAGDVF